MAVIHFRNMPELGGRVFQCPHCGIAAQQLWDGARFDYRESKFEVHISECTECEGQCLWVDQKMLIPTSGGTMRPSADMPDNVKADYNEAASVMQASPRAAAALLRLALEKLCDHEKVGAKGGSLQAKIDYLEKEKNLSVELVQAMDAVRVIGNEAVHPGMLDLRDDAKTVKVLFGLINFIIDELITKPAQRASFYESVVPNSKKRKGQVAKGGAGDSGK